MAQRRKLPPLNALRAFEAAARHMSFKDAADELCVTATAVSHQIRHLETLVGMKLFERTPRSIALTAAGARLYPVLRESFDRITSGVNELSSVSHQVRISCTPAFAAKVLVPALPGLHDEQPQLHLEIDATEKVVDVKRGDADLAIRYGRAVQPGLQSHALVGDEYIAVASPGHAGGALPLEPQAIADRRLLRFAWKNESLGGPTWGRWMAAAGVAHFDETRCLTMSEEHLVIQAALDGAGIALVSNVLVRRDLLEGRLAQVHPVALPGLQFTCVHAHDNPKTESLAAVVTWLRRLLVPIGHEC